jgi:RNA polymerase sigma-70 factor (ECF subfamily)
MNTFAQIPVFNSEERLLTSSLAPVPDPCHAERAFLLVTSADGFLDRAKQARGKSGDARDEKIAHDSAFSALVDRHARLMYQIAYSLLRNSQDAEDAVQEAFLKLYRSASWRRMNDEKAFLARTVWRVALDRMPRAQQESLDESHGQFAVKEDSPETRVIRKAQAGYLRKLIDALPENLGQVLVLSAIEELSSREVALLIGIPEGTVRTRLMQAREELRRRFNAANRSRK